jgi:hypothetical protein
MSKKKRFSYIISMNAFQIQKNSKVLDNDSVDSFEGVEFHLYLFANPRSGSQKAKRFT